MSPLTASLTALDALGGIAPEWFLIAAELCLSRSGKVIVTGMGKAGLIGQKTSATLRSTGQPSAFLDPAQALHGDMGMIDRQDVLFAISNSGKTEEVLAVVDYARGLSVPVIGLCGSATSPLARAADVPIVYAIEHEGCPLNRAPMASAVVQLVIGDMLAAELIERRGFTEADFLALHHGGYLGQSIRAKVAQTAES
jgi:arabinose-5-phosphate isomerase